MQSPQSPSRQVARWALLLCLSTSCGRAQWRDADARLNEAVKDARAAGYQPLAGPHNTFGAFTAAGESEWRVQLEAHASYFLAAACTAGCDSLAFVVRDPHGAMIGADTSGGPIGRLQLTTAAAGDFSIRFAHGRCAEAGCRWVAQLYGKP
jgi:hypothetical protein